MMNDSMFIDQVDKEKRTAIHKINVSRQCMTLYVIKGIQYV